MSRVLSNQLAALYEGRALRDYVRWKVRLDPAYEAVSHALRGHERPVVDVGCGIGILALYLRACGFAPPIVGIDFDERKIARARKAAEGHEGLTFAVEDARAPLPPEHSVIILDLLHYFDGASQQQILRNAAAATPAGGRVIIRQPVRDASWRYRITKAVDASARLVRWMRAEELNYPTKEALRAPFEGFDEQCRPLWGSTPYNTWFFVFTRRE